MISHTDMKAGSGWHTPGPWSIVEYGDGDSLAIRDGDSANRICFMATHGGSEKQWRTIQANAALISAAPDLLEALSAILQAEQGGEGWTLALMHAHAAIARAIGASP